MSLWEKIEPHLMRVRTPAQYIGGEWNSVRKDPAACDLRVALAFPDTYSIGMSHLGLQILYGLLNERPGVLCERAFCPWPDLEAIMRREGIPAFTLENHLPLREFHIVGISLQSEMGYSNVVNLLDLAGIPLFARDRGPDDPLVVGGGPNASCAEPVADFFDVMVLGDGEEAAPALVEVCRELRGRDRRDRLREIVRRVPGAYVPSFYEVEYDGPRIAGFRPLEGAPPVVPKATVPLEPAYFPVRPVVPYSETVFDRIHLEVMRGCPHRCRFCHAVSFKNKLRFRTVETLVRLAVESYAATGLDEISLVSLSSGDYPHLRELMERLHARFAPLHVRVALPSLRIDERLKELPALMRTGRRAGFTVAPEAGTEEFRRVIRKPIRDRDLFDTARAAFEEGFTHVKLYFMCGLPQETEADLRGIVETARRIAAIGREVRRRFTAVPVTISPFVPKPHTPFQFAPFRSFEYFARATALLRDAARRTPVKLKIHDPRNSYIEAALARGDRRLSRVLVEAHALGARFDEWSEHFSFERWIEAFRRAGIDPDDYARRTYGADEPMPWDLLNVGVSKKYLWEEWTTSQELASKRGVPMADDSSLPAPVLPRMEERAVAVGERHPSLPRSDWVDG